MAQNSLERALISSGRFSSLSASLPTQYTIDCKMEFKYAILRPSGASSNNASLGRFGSYPNRAENFVIAAAFRRATSPRSRHSLALDDVQPTPSTQRGPARAIEIHRL